MGTYDIVRAAIMTPTRRGWGIPVMLRGDVGIGKTSMLELIAEQINAWIEILTLSLVESVEAAGYPYIEEVDIGEGKHTVKRKQMSYAAPAWAQRAVQAARAVIFLDEINTAAPQTFAAFMRAVNERACGSFALGDGVRFIAAMNPTEVAQAAGGSDIPMALANRFCHLDVGLPEFSQWASWLSLKESDDSVKSISFKDEAAVMKAWGDPYARASAEVIGFLLARPNRRAVQPDPSDPKASGAWASPRTWEMFTRARASAVVHGLSHDDAMAFEEGCIGRALTGEFRTWVADSDLPSAKDWLQGKVDFEADPRRLDRTQAHLVGCAIEWTRMEAGNRQKELTRLVRFMGKFLDRRDVLIAATGLLSDGGLEKIRKEVMALDAEDKAVLAKIGAIRNEANTAMGVR